MPPVTYRPHAAIRRSVLVLTSRFHVACNTAEPSARNVAATKASFSPESVDPGGASNEVLTIPSN